MLACVLQDVDERVADLARRSQDPRVGAVGEHFAAATPVTVQRLRDPHEQTLHSTRDRTRALGLGQDAHVIRLPRIFDRAVSRTPSASPGRTESVSDSTSDACQRQRVAARSECTANPRSPRIDSAQIAHPAHTHPCAPNRRRSLHTRPIDSTPVRPIDHDPRIRRTRPCASRAGRSRPACNPRPALADIQPATMRLRFASSNAMRRTSSGDSRCNWCTSVRSGSTAGNSPACTNSSRTRSRSSSKRA